MLLPKNSSLIVLSIVVATENRMKHLKMLKVDTGDPEIDETFHGAINVLTDYKVTQKVPIE